MSDKVRIKQGAHRGQRGVIESVDGNIAAIRLEDVGTLLRLPLMSVTNLSLAARKAWATEPRRAVGRRKGTRVCDRLSVTLRFDRELWERFVNLERDGTIDNRTDFLNRWLREKLSVLVGNG